MQSKSKLCRDERIAKKFRVSLHRLKFAQEQYSDKKDSESLGLLNLWEAECYEQGQTY